MVAPPLAAIPVNDGIEKKVTSQAAGAVSAIDASLVFVAVSGLLALPLAPTVKADVRVCTLPGVAVEKFHMTSIGVVVRQPVRVVVSAAVVKPPASVVLVGKSTPVTVTG